MLAVRTILQLGQYLQLLQYLDQFRLYLQLGQCLQFRLYLQLEQCLQLGQYL